MAVKTGNGRGVPQDQPHQAARVLAIDGFTDPASAPALADGGTDEIPQILPDLFTSAKDAPDGPLVSQPQGAGPGDEGPQAVPTVLARGRVAIVSYETDQTAGAASPDALRFVVLEAIGSGTQIFFSDRAWNGSAFAAAGGGEGTYTYTAGADIPAGTVITITGAQLAAAGVTLSNAGETLYVYQGTDANTPTTFLFAADIADGNSTFNGNLTGTGLTVGVNAVAVSHDNARFVGQSTGIAATQLDWISNNARWQGSDQDDIGGTTGYSEVSDTTISGPLTNPHMQVFSVMAGGGQSDAILRMDGADGSSVGTNLAGLFRDNPAFNHLSDLSFDVEAGYFFFVDSNGTTTNRIMRGDIADLANGNPSPSFTQIFATDGDGEIIPTMEINAVTNKIYWMDGDIFGDFDGGFQLWEANYDGTGARLVTTLDTENPDPDFGFPGGVGDFVVYNAGNVAYVVHSTASIDGFGNANVLQNHILQVDLTTGAVTVLGVGSDATPGYNAGRLAPLEGQIIGIDVDQRNGDIYFITQPISADDSGGIFRYIPGTDTLIELWNQPTNNAHSTLQTFPTSNMTHIEFDEVSGRYFVSATSDTDTENDGTPGTNESDASIFVGDPAGGAPTLFMRAYEPTANGAPQGMEINYAPTISVTDAGSTYTEGAASVAVFSASTIADPDQAVIKGAVVAITGGFIAGVDTLSFTAGGGITGSWNAATGVLTLSGDATFAQYQTVLNSVRFAASGDNPTAYGSNAVRSFSASVTDGLVWSNLGTATVDITGVNDAPVNVVPGAAIDGLEDGPAVAVTGLSVSDVDADPATQTITVTLSVTDGTLTISTAVVNGLGAGGVSGNGTDTLVLTGTQNQINATLANATALQFQGAADFNGDVTLTMTTNDGGANGNDPGLTGTGTTEADTDTVTITVASVNDAPAGADGDATILEDGVYVFAASDFGFSDVIDGDDLAGIVFTTLPANGVLVVVDEDGDVVDTLSAGDSVTVAQLNDGLVQYRPDLNESGAPHDTFTFQVLDDGGTDDGGVDRDQSPNTFTFDVTAVNDAPALDLNGASAGEGSTASYVENDGPVLLAPDGLLSDVDSANLTGATVTITDDFQASADYLTVDGATGGVLNGVTFSYNASTGVLTLSGSATVAVYQGVLRQIGFESTSNAPGVSRTLSWTVTDGAATSSAVTTAITVTPVEDAAVADDDSNSTGESDPVSGSVFGNDSDPDGPALEVAEVNGSAAAVGVEITLPSGALLTMNADGTYIYDPNGVFPNAPAAGSGGTPVTDTFTYTLVGGGTATVTITIVGEDDGDVVIGDGGDNALNGGVGDDILRGGGGNDVLDGGDGIDTADYTDAASGVVVRLLAGLTPDDGDGGVDSLVSIENVTGSDFNDTLLGSAGANVLSGGGGRDYLLGLGGNDILHGGSGDANQLQGGTGDDDYYVDANDTIVEFVGEGHDRVFTTQGRLVLAANVEDLIYVGAGAFTGIGNNGDNTITGGDGDDTLSGRGGDDTLDGGDGTDTADYSLASGSVSAFLDGTAAADGDGGTDTLTGIENLLGSAFADQLYGSAGNNVLDGGGGGDVLIGRGGNDTLRGGDGFDLVDYSDATSGVFVKLNIGRASDGEGGTDTLISIEDVNGSLFNDVLVGSTEDNILYGLDGADYLVGLDGDDLLLGGAGASNQLQGGLGDDRYYVEANDTLIEFEDEGYDSVATTLNSYTLRAHFEELAFDGVGDFVGTGNDLDNFIYGGEGDDILTGGLGDDVLIGSSSCGCGGPGFDTVVLAGVFADYLIEDLGGGAWSITDTVADRDGADVLLDIAQLRFSDGSVFALVPADDAPALAEAKWTDDAQVLPGLVEGDFVLGKEGDLPLVLPGDDSELEGLLTVDGALDISQGLPSHMLTLHPEGGFTSETDDLGRLHDHDGWLF